MVKRYSINPVDVCLVEDSDGDYVLATDYAAVEERAEQLRQWVHDCQAGMYINCVYCGHRYGPDDEVPATMAEVLKEHIEQCPEHPMSALKAERDQLAEENALLRRALLSEEELTKEEQEMVRKLEAVIASRKE